MRTAIILSGHMRSFDRCLPNLAYMVFRHFGELSFFVSTVKDKDSSKAELLRLKYPNSQVEIEVVDSQPLFEFDHDWTPGRPYTHEPYAISVSPQAVLGQLWQLQRGYRLYLSKLPEQKQHDCIIRCRPDLWFHSFETNSLWVDLPIPSLADMLEVITGRSPVRTRVRVGDSCLTPWWGRFGGINDRFAIMGRDAALPYFHTFERSEDLMKDGCPLHPESLVKASLEKGGVSLLTSLKAEFSTLRTDGGFRLPEICAADIAHACMK